MPQRHPRAAATVTALLTLAGLAASPAVAGAQTQTTSASAPKGGPGTGADRVAAAYRAGVALALARSRASLDSDRVVVRPQGPGGPELAGIPLDRLQRRLATIQLDLTAAFDGPELEGMRAYVDARFPSPSLDVPIVGAWQGRFCTTPAFAQGMMGRVGALVDRLDRAGASLLVDLTLRSDQPGATIVLQAPGGGRPHPGATNGTLRLYRGLYAYAVRQDGFADGAGDGIDLVDQPATTLRCTMRPLAATPAPAGARPASSVCTLADR